MHRIVIALSLLAGVFVSNGARAASLDDFLGKWELAIVDLGSSFRSCALKIERKGDGIGGEMVWRWGSVFRIDGKARAGEKGELTIESGEFAAPLVIRRVGDYLEGSTRVKERDETRSVHVLGWRARDELSAAGTWDLKARIAEGERTSVVRLLRRPGADWEAEVTGHDGKPVAIQDLSVDGPVVRLTFDLEGRKGEFRGEVRGNRMTGTARVPDRDELTFEGTRRLKLGAPVKLIPESGLAGWKPREAGKRFGWKSEGGVLTNGEHDVDIVSEREFQDFQLHVEFKVEKGGNSGVYLRGRYEVQIQDDFGKPLESHGIGAIYSRAAPSKNAAKPAGEWQSFDITLVGRWLTVKLNDTTVIEETHLDGITGGALSPSESDPGPLMLQGDHGKIWFRNLIVTPIELE